MHQRLARSLKGRQGRAAALLVVAGILLIAVPTVMIGGSFAKHMSIKPIQLIENDSITIKQPDPQVADWPLIGKRVYKSWNMAADNLPVFLKEK